MHLARRSWPVNDSLIGLPLVTPGCAFCVLAPTYYKWSSKMVTSPHKTKPYQSSSYHYPNLSENVEQHHFSLCLYHIPGTVDYASKKRLCGLAEQPPVLLWFRQRSYHSQLIHHIPKIFAARIRPLLSLPFHHFSPCITPPAINHLVRKRLPRGLYSSHSELTPWLIHKRFIEIDQRGVIRVTSFTSCQIVLVQFTQSARAQCR